MSKHFSVCYLVSTLSVNRIGLVSFYFLLKKSTQHEAFVCLHKDCHNNILYKQFGQC